MATGADEKWVIDKLDGPNWTTWKFQMKHLLLAKGLWGVVDGTEVLADDAAEGVCTEFQKKSQKGFFYTCPSNNCLPVVLGNVV